MSCDVFCCHYFYNETHEITSSESKAVMAYCLKPWVMHSWTGGDLFILSDLDWSWFEPEVLVTSSVDTYIYIWDTR